MEELGDDNVVTMITESGISGRSQVHEHVRKGRGRIVVYSVAAKGKKQWEP
jgi:hypothetical protein